MLTFLFVVLLISSVYFVFHFKKEMFLQKRQLMLLKHANDNLKCKMINKSTDKCKVDITFITPDFSTAFITEKCFLCLSPMENSPIIAEIESDTEVTIKDSAEINGESWYEICLDCKNEPRIKGWIKSQYILPK